MEGSCPAAAARDMAYPGKAEEVRVDTAALTAPNGFETPCAPRGCFPSWGACSARDSMVVFGHGRTLCANGKASPARLTGCVSIPMLVDSFGVRGARGRHCVHTLTCTGCLGAEGRGHLAPSSADVRFHRGAAPRLRHRGKRTRRSLAAFWICTGSARPSTAPARASTWSSALHGEREPITREDPRR